MYFKLFEDEDTIIKLPTDPQELEAYFKTLPPEVIEGFAQNMLKEGERKDPSDMEKTIRETIFRLASANKDRSADSAS
jgi:hypothetical protein